MRRVATVLACALATVALGAAPAAAHDELVDTSPADGSTVDVAPDQVVLTFAAPAEALGTQVLVTGPDGADLTQGDAQLVGSTVVQPLAPARPAGVYRVDWRVTSDDGHPVTGTFTFTATDPTPPATAASATPPGPSATTPAAVPAPAPSPSTLTSPPGTMVKADTMTVESGRSTFVGILVLVLVVLALVVVRVGRAHSLRRIAARRAAVDETAGTGGTPGGA